MMQEQNKSELRKTLKQLSDSIKNIKKIETDPAIRSQLDLVKARTYIMGQYFRYKPLQTKQLEEAYNQLQLSSYFPYDEELMEKLVISNAFLEGQNCLKSIRNYEQRCIILFILFFSIFCGSLVLSNFYENSLLMRPIMLATGITSAILVLPTALILYEQYTTDTLENDINMKWEQLYKNIGGEIMLEYQKVFKNLLDYIVELQQSQDLDFIMPVYKEEILNQDFSIVQNSSITMDKPKVLYKSKKINDGSKRI